MLPRFSNEQIAGITIVLSSLISVILMAHHPTTAAHELSQQVAEVAHETRLNNFVHGGLILLLFLNLAAFIIFSINRGLNQLSVLIALLAFFVCTLLMTGAALVNGFIYPDFLQQVANQQSDLLAYTPLIRAFSWNINQTLANTSVIATSLAIFLWSLNLYGSDFFQKLVAMVGVLFGALISVLMFSGELQLDLKGMTAVVIAQTLWNCGIAYLLIFKKLK